MADQTFNMTFSCIHCRTSRRIIVTKFTPVKFSKESEPVYFMAQCVDSNSDGTKEPKEHKYEAHMSPQVVEARMKNELGQAIGRFHYEKFHPGLKIPDVIDISN